MESCSISEAKHTEALEEKVILIGNPNVGKSVIFNYLTGKYVTVSNYPGTTVEVSTGTLSAHGKKFQVLDTPGVNSLIPMSEDEKVTRDILLKEPQSYLIQVIDTKNIRRGLLISLQLFEMGLPFIVLLNMWDEAKSRGIEIQTEALSKILGVPILKTVATRRKGLEKIKDHLISQVHHPDHHHQQHHHLYYHYPEAIEADVSRIISLLPESPISRRSLALMVLSGDETLVGWLHKNLSAEKILQIEKIRQEIQVHFADPIGYLINQARLRKVDELLSQVMGLRGEAPKSVAAFLGNLSIHPFWGVPVLLFILWITYEFVGVFGAQTCVKFLEETLFGKWLLPPITYLVQRLIPIPFFQELFIGPYGVITMALTYAIAIVLPIVGCFFLVFGLMEDSGYLPRLAVMTNQVFKKMGLNGKAVLPMVLGLGCDTMATMTTRILETEKDRTIVTLLLALAVPCSAQLGIILGMFASLPALYFLTWIFMIAGILILVGYLASRVIPGEGSDFILEIPPLRVPLLSNVMVKTLARMEWYLKEAVPLFILGTLILFGLHKTNILTLLEKAATPLIVYWLGLPAKATEAFIIGFLRRDYGAAGLFVLAKGGQLNPHQILVSLVTITLFIPCIAHFFMMIKERGLRKALWISAVVIPIAFGVGGMVNFLLKFFGV
ncbi:MAG: ferrous iron transport protein B [Deltaproteobacteria bacterium RBG_16_47_11]|nr:MAG: ferrous iron transport protein B [Deltaproteobacteria bacterium RBG_16_47_11]